MTTAHRRARTSICVAALAVLGLGSASVAHASGGVPSESPGNSGATITGSFSTDCTDFSTSSSKDLSHVELAFADGSSSQVQDFGSSPMTYAVMGDKVIASTDVKSGTTTQHFSCTPPPPPPPPAPKCSDGIDNDGDGLADAADPGCQNPGDNDETNPVTPPQCSDGVDNDQDGVMDADDPGCENPNDNDETDHAKAACEDGIDNDNDGKVDFPADKGCSSAQDTDEADPPACADGVDNDNDGKVDAADPGCTGPTDNDETDPVVVPVNPCSHGGLADATLAKTLYDGLLKQVPVLKDPHAGGPLSKALDDNLTPLNPVGHEVGCAVSLVDGP
jgi:hypothetical protein